MVRHADKEKIAIKEEVYTHRFLDTRDTTHHTDTGESTRMGAGVEEGIAW